MEETEQDGLVGTEVLKLLRDLTFHQQTKLAGPAVPHRELERHVELLTLKTSRRYSADLPPSVTGLSPGR